MWEAIASPVLDALGFNSPPDNGSWPRVWWCPTGPLAFLPLHAMGLHAPDAPPGACVLDRVVSSYTPTLRALVRSRDRKPPGPERQRMLMVAMEQTPGMQALPNARDELRLVRGHFGESCTARSGPEASRAGVLSELSGHSWAHFCCHGDMDSASPSDSGIELYDARLTVGDIAGLDLEEAEFAFLPSCRTAVSDFELLDEAIHLSAALHFAGYRHVVATLWSVYDQFATYIADHVYNSTVTNGKLDAQGAALALHEAVRELRREPGMELIGWTPFIHTGP
jgi:CHAT domain-containing protein